MAWSNPGISLKGIRGAQILFGARDPVAGDGFDGDGWINTQTGRLFAQKASGAWPSTYASLIGPAGASVRVGNGVPTSSNPSVQSDADLYVQLDATGGPSLFGPRSSGTWPSTGTSLAGVAGASFLSGNGPPSNSLGTAATPGYYDYTNFVIYGPKKSDGTWPAGNSLVGPKGSQFYYDTAEPGLQLGTVGDFFLRTDTYNFYQKVTNAAAATTAQYPNGWIVMANLKGVAGSPGTNGVSPPGLFYGTSNPSSVVGAQVGSFYINTNTSTLFGPLASGGWPSSGISLVGPAGVQPPGVYSGSGAPSTTTAPGAVSGSYYIRTDVTPLTLYGPLANGTWPTTGISMSGSQIYSGSGAPTTQGNVNDYYFDTTTGAVKLYPAKTASGWTAAPVSLTGSPGPTGAPGATTLGAQAGCPGAFLGMTSQAQSATPYVLPIVGTTTPGTFTPLSASALVGVSTYTSVACTLTLYDVTASANIYQVNLAANVNTAGTYFNVTQYPIPANHTVQWQITGSGTQGMSLQPYYLMPSSTPGVCVCPVGAAGFSNNQTFSGTAVNLPYFGSSQQWAHVPARTGGLYAAQATYTPASGTPSTASVTIAMRYSTLNGSSSGTYGTTFSAVTANGQSQTILAPRLTDFTSFASGYFFTMSATGSGSGTLQVVLQAIV